MNMDMNMDMNMENMGSNPHILTLNARFFKLDNTILPTSFEQSKYNVPETIFIVKHYNWSLDKFDKIVTDVDSLLVKFGSNIETFDEINQLVADMQHKYTTLSNHSKNASETSEILLHVYYMINKGGYCDCETNIYGIEYNTPEYRAWQKLNVYASEYNASVNASISLVKDILIMLNHLKTLVNQAYPNFFDVSDDIIDEKINEKAAAELLARTITPDESPRIAPTLSVRKTGMMRQYNMSYFLNY